MSRPTSPTTTSTQSSQMPPDENSPVLPTPQPPTPPDVENGGIKTQAPAAPPSIPPSTSNPVAPPTNSGDNNSPVSNSWNNAAQSYRIQAPNQLSSNQGASTQANSSNKVHEEASTGGAKGGAFGRTIVLCFDGTGNKFGRHNSNVIRFFGMLKRDQPDKQIVYYQAGIGTYQTSKLFTTAGSVLYSKVDEAIAINMGDHVKDGYRFLMQTYQKGDRVCLFGFSRGAYTARALSGMIYKIGLLPAYNMEQVDFAYSIYSATDKKGSELGSKFRRTFSISIKVDFVGVWDTVSSVGIIPQSLPYSSQNDGVLVFRHALALDECRARFRPLLWGEPNPVREELDDEPDLGLFRNFDNSEIPNRVHLTERDKWVYYPPGVTDVKEVWFAGAHADVGGGSHEDELDTSLSNITLRWMIKECFIQKTGIIFKEESLNDIDLDFKELETDPKNAKTYSTLESIDSVQAAPETRDKTDPLAAIYNQLQLAWFWWPLEFIPMLATRQKEDGKWSRFRFRNLGQGRYVPLGIDHKVEVHSSVRARMKHTKYKPAAVNWDILEKQSVEWVDSEGEKT